MTTSKLVDEIGSFTAVPNWAIEIGDKIGTDGLVLLMALRYHSGVNNEIFPAYDLLQEHTGLTRRRIAIAIRKLEELKIIERRRRFGQSTIYRLKNLLTTTSSTPPVLMDETPVVQQVDCISPPPVPSVVQQVHTNKTHLTRLIEPEEEGPPAPTFSDPSLQIMPMITRVSGMVYIPDQSKREPIIRMIEEYGLEKTEDALKQQCDKWRKTPRKNNSGCYSVTNMGWVDWAQDELVGKPAEKKLEDCVTVDEMIEWHNTHQQA